MQNINKILSVKISFPYLVLPYSELLSCYHKSPINKTKLLYFIHARLGNWIDWINFQLSTWIPFLPVLLA